MNILKFFRILLILIFISVLGINCSQAGMSIKAYGNFSGSGLPIAGTTISDLYAAEVFPNAPDVVDSASSIPGLSSQMVDNSSGRFEWPQPTAAGNSGVDNHGIIFQGVFIAPVDGTYQFFIRSDDGSALYLTDLPLDLEDLVDESNRPIPDALESSCCGQFGKPGTISDLIEMSSGQAKFLTLALKEGGGGDWMQVGLSIDSGPVEVLSLGHVQRYEFSEEAPAKAGLSIAGFGPDGVIDQFSIELNESETAHVYVEFDAEIESLDDIPAITWKVDGEEIEGVRGSQLHFIPMPDLAEDQISRMLTAEVQGFGEASLEVLVNRDKDEPALVGAKGHGDPRGILVTFSEPVDWDSAIDVTNYTISGQDVSINSAEFNSTNSILLRTSEFSTQPMQLSVSGVTDTSLAKNLIESSTLDIVLTSNLLAYWSFNDSDNQSIAVDSASGIIGQIKKAVYTDDQMGASGKSGDFAMDFGTESNGQHVFIEDATFLNASAESNQMSVSFWQKNHATGNSSSYWMFSPGVNGGGRGNQVHLPSSNQQVYFDTQGCCSAATERINKRIDTFDDYYQDFFLDWHHYTFIKNHDLKEIWIDGKLFHEGSNTEDFTPDFTRLSIGSGDLGANSSQAILDDFTIFSQALNENEIRQLANGSSPLELSESLSKPLTLKSDLSGGIGGELLPLTLSIDVEGGPDFTIGYQWYKNGQRLVKATEKTLSWDKIPLSEHGNKYRVEAFNKDGSFNRIISKDITINLILPDPIELIGLNGGPQNTFIELHFDGFVDPNSFSKDSFEVSTSGRVIEVIEARLLPDEQSIRLLTETQEEGAFYSVNIESIKSQSAIPDVVRNMEGTFLSWKKQPFGSTALLYPNTSSNSIDLIPIGKRGTGNFPPNYAPFRLNTESWQNINQGFSSIITYLESPNSGDINITKIDARKNYAQILTGWLKPSVSGQYILALAAGNQAELYLSTDHLPSNSKLVASETQWNANRQYNDLNQDSNWSDPIDLVAGKEYFFEAYINKGLGLDNFAIAWTFTTDGSEPSVPVNGSNPIPGENLLTYQPIYYEHSVLEFSPSDSTFQLPNDTEISLHLRDGIVEMVDAESFEVLVLQQCRNVISGFNVSKDALGITNLYIETDLQPGHLIEVFVDYSLKNGEKKSISWSFSTSLFHSLPLNFISSEGLLNYWDFEGHAYDTAGYYAGSASTSKDHGIVGDGVSFVNGGPFGQFANFSGNDKDGFIEVPDSEDILAEGESLSVSLWFKVGGFNKNWQTLLAHGEGRDYRIARNFHTSGIAYNGGNGEPRTSLDLNDGNWHHIATITDTDSSSLYIDGNLYDSRSSTGIRNSSTGRLLIGANPGSNTKRSWQGFIDEVSMWNRPLSEPDIYVLSRSGRSLDESLSLRFNHNETIMNDSPILYYSFEEEAGQSTENKGTLGELNNGLWMSGEGSFNSNSAEVSYGPGPRPDDGFVGFSQDNNAALFNGSVDKLWIDLQGPIFNNRQAFTLECWIKPQNRLDTTWESIGVIGQNNIVKYGFFNTRTIHTWTQEGGQLNTNYPFNDDEWHHIAVVADGTSIKHFLDGLFINQSQRITLDFGHSNSNTRIGGGGIFDEIGNHFTGLIDEVAIYPRALSSGDIFDHYRGGAIGLEIDLPSNYALDCQVLDISINQETITLIYTGALQVAPTVVGPWFSIEDAQSPYAEQISDEHKFYRVVAP